MSAKVGVLIIHGMGKQQADFAQPLIDNLCKRLGPDAAKWIAFESCHWANILQGYQNTTWQRLTADSPMDGKRMRDFFVSWLGDAVNYLTGYYKPFQRGYSEIHECVCSSLSNLEQRVEPGSPLIVLAHSLGSVIMNNYIWDEQNPNRSSGGISKTAYQRAEMLTTFVTYGSNIPLFLPPQETIECITFPPPNLPARYAEIAKWINIYDADDVLGYPLHNIWTDTHGTEIRDMALNIGLPLVSETFLSHMFYDSDSDFLKVVADEIQLNLAVSGIIP